MESKDISSTFKGLKPFIVLPVFSTKLTEILNGHTAALCNGKPLLSAGGIVEKEDPFPHSDEEKIDGHISMPSIQGLTCATCKIRFQNVAEQRMHFKLDWHRLNVKYSLEGKKILNEEEFEQHISDVSSISGSDSESDADEDHESVISENSPSLKEQEGTGSVKKERPESYNRMFYYDGAKNAYSMYKCLLKEERKEMVLDFVSAINELRASGCCIIIAMMSGGHFASGIFHGEQLMEHKTFHRYTVRAKRGTSQGVHDNTKFARSAGASIRRHNEAALAEDIKEIFERWSSHVAHASHIFLKFPAHSKPVFFGKGKPFNKGDKRIRKIPFISRRPTLKEVERVYAELTSIRCFDVTSAEIPAFSPSSECTYQDSETMPKLPIANNVLSATARGECKKSEKEGIAFDGACVSPIEDHHNRTFVDNAMSSGSPTLPLKVSDDLESDSERIGSKDSHSTVHTTYGESMVENRSSALKINETETKVKAHDTKQRGMFDRLITFCDKGDVTAVEKLFCKSTCTPVDSCQLCVETKAAPSELQSIATISDLSEDCQFCKLLNLRDEKGQTLLHKAAMNGHCDLIWLLMRYGADPSICCDRAKTPYAVTKSKDARNAFRRFMAEFPLKYDYQAAQIPTPLTAAMEEERNRKANEKKKAQRKARKAKEKARKLAGAIGESVDSEDHAATEVPTERELRAMAAERRFGSQLTQSSRCANCGTLVSTKEAFTRHEYMYCTTDCVHEHRQKIGK